MTLDPTPDLARLGDDLERAAGAQLRTGRRARTVRTAAFVASVAVLLTATAAAAGLFTPKQVAASLPASAVIFGSAHPVCALDADGATYHCTLDAAPVPDEAGVTPPPAKAGEAADEPMTYVGRKQPIAIDGVIAGGCVGRSSDGLAWDCYIGQDAVDQQIVTQDFLGDPAAGPGRG